MKRFTDFYIILVTALILLASIVFSIYYNIPFSDLSRDPLADFDTSPFLGIISNMGVILWSMSLGMTLFTFLIVKLNINLKLFFLTSIFLNLILLLDDFMMLHEKILPELLHIYELKTYFIYAFSVIVYLLIFYKIHLKSNYLLLMFSLGLFGTSILVDRFFHDYIDIRYLHIIEDGSKFMGIGFWMNYYYGICKTTLHLKVL